MRKTPVVMGVLSMVFGGIQLMMSGLGLATAPLSKKMLGSMGKAFSNLPREPGQPDVGDMFARLGKMIEELKLYTYLTAGAMTVFAIALILIGVQLYKRRAQSRPLSIAWAAAGLAYLPVELWVRVKIILPRTEELTKAMMVGNPGAGFVDAMSSMQATATIIGYLLLYVPFPLLLLWLIGRPSAKNDLMPAS